MQELSPKEKRQRFKEMALSRVGETNKNRLGSVMVVDQYNGSQDVIVRFVDHGNTVKCTWQQFIKGSVKNVYDKSKFGIGFIGEGKHSIRENDRYTDKYLTWSGMLMRCFSKRFLEDHPTYKDCTVCEEWHCYQNFADWYDENYYEVEGHRMHLDKDILVKGNRVYSPDTCAFVPQFINGMFIGRKALRGNLPIGVKTCSRYENKYEVRCCDSKGGRKYLKTFNSPEEAFEAYKEYKEQVIKDIAEEYKLLIPDNLYEAMMNYIVEVTD